MPLAAEPYLTTCWNCLGEFDALGAVWCSDDPKNPTKLCPFCFQCFCDASEKYKQEFWRGAPARLRDELATLSRSKDRLGDVLIRMKKLTTPQLLEALVEQKESGRRLGEILTERGLVKPDDVQAALRTQGANPLTDTRGQAFSAQPVWDQSSPEAIIQYVLSLAARKGASDVQLEPGDENIAVKYRIDGFSFRVDPIPKDFQQPLTDKLFEVFRLDPQKANRPQTSRTTGRLGDGEFDLVAQTLPTPHGVAASVKLINRATFLKDFTTLGLEIEDRVRLLEELRGTFGLLLVSSPVYNGAHSTAYSIMSFLVRAQRELVSIEAPMQWSLEGARQVDLGPDPRAMAETLRSVMAVRPEVLVLSAVPDQATARLAAQLASSVLVIATLPAQSAAHAIASVAGLGVPAQLLSSVLVASSCQRLVRLICRICREPAEPPAPQTLAHHGITPQEAATLRFFRGKGCPTCNRVGYRGRRAVFELMNGAPEVRTGILGGLQAEELEALGVGAGMTRVRERCLDLVRQGLTTFDEFARLRL